MTVPRLLTMGLAAAVLGCIGAALVLVGRVDQSSFIPVPVMWLSSVVLLTPVNARLRTRGLEMPLRSVPLIVVGTFGFAGIAGLLSGGAVGSAVMGGVYGMLTAAAWAGLEALLPRRVPSD